MAVSHNPCRGDGSHSESLGSGLRRRQPGGSSGLGNPRKIRHHVPHSETRSALEVTVVQMAIGEKVPLGWKADTR